jgi:hypothetical protein
MTIFRCFDDAASFIGSASLSGCSSLSVGIASSCSLLSKTSGPLCCRDYRIGALMCHRQIVDEGGTLYEDGSVYHDACSDKLEKLEDLRKEAGVPYSEAIQTPKARGLTE